MLRFSANLSLLFPHVPLLQRFQLAKQQGFDAVEIQFPYTLDAHIIRQELDKYQLKLVLFNIAADDLLQGGEGLAAVPEKKPQFIQALNQATDYAKILQPNAINVLPGRCFNNSRITAYQHTLTENLQMAIAIFSPLRIKTVFEAINPIDMPGFIVHSGAQMLNILSTISHPDLLLQYDIYHMLMVQEDPGSFITQHANKIGHIQFADCPGRHQPGTGDADFQAIFTQIKNSHYQGWTGAEYNPLGDSSASLAWFEHYLPEN